MNEAALKQLEKVEDEIDLLREILEDNDEEKRHISMLVSGTPDLHIRNPELYEKMAPYGMSENADKYPPFNEQTWLLTGMYGRDMRPSYETIERMKSANPTAAWDNLKVKP